MESGYGMSNSTKEFLVSYQNEKFLLECSEDFRLNKGLVRLTTAGNELLPIMNPKKYISYKNQTIQNWKKAGFLVSQRK